jgi:hypothetical protein
MTVDEKVQAVLIANPALTARVPASRIKTPGDYQGLAQPYIIHFPQVGRVHQCSDEGTMALREWDFYSIEVWAATHGEARSIGDLVAAALDRYEDADVQRCALAQPPSAGPYDTDRKAARVIVDFEISGTLT